MSRKLRKNLCSLVWYHSMVLLSYKKCWKLEFIIKSHNHMHTFLEFPSSLWNGWLIWKATVGSPVFLTRVFQHLMEIWVPFTINLIHDDVQVCYSATSNRGHLDKVDQSDNIITINHSKKAGLQSYMKLLWTEIQL